MLSRVPFAARKIADNFKDLLPSYPAVKGLQMALSQHIMGYSSGTELIRNATWTYSPSHFFTLSKNVEAQCLMERNRTAALKWLNNKHLIDGKFIYVLDDTDNPKYCTNEAIGKFKSSKGFYEGQCISVLVLVDLTDKVAIPLAFGLKLKEGHPNYIKGTHFPEIAMQTILDKGFPKLPLVCDAWFDSKEISESLSQLGIPYVWELKGSRSIKNLTDNSTEFENIGDVFYGRSKTETNNQFKEESRYLSEIEAKIRDHDKKLIVIGVYNHSANKSAFAYYASNSLSISGAKIWELSRARWTIESLFRDLKHHLGFGDWSVSNFNDCNLSICIPLILAAFIRMFPEKLGLEKDTSITAGIAIIRQQEKMAFLKSLRSVNGKDIILNLMNRGENAPGKPRVTTERNCNKATRATAKKKTVQESFESKIAV
jgi:hypothetical protein